MLNAKRFRVDFFNLGRNGQGYVFDKTRFFYNLSFRELYNHLVHFAKDHSNPDLLAIYVSRETISDFGGVNVNPIFSIHIGEHIWVEDSKSFICAMLK